MDSDAATSAALDARTVAWLNSAAAESGVRVFDGGHEIARVVTNVVYGDFPQPDTQRPMLLWWRSVGRLSAVRCDEMHVQSVMQFEATDRGLAVLRMFPWHLVRREQTFGITYDNGGNVEIAYKHLARLYGVERLRHVYYLRRATLAGETFVCFNNLSLPNPDSDSEHSSDDDDDMVKDKVKVEDKVKDRVEPGRAAVREDSFAALDARIIAWLNEADRLPRLHWFDGGHDLARVAPDVVYGDFEQHAQSNRPLLVWWRSIGRLSAVRFNAMREDAVMHFEPTDCGLAVLRLFPWHLVRTELICGVSCNINGAVEIAFRHLARLYGVDRWQHVHYRNASARESYVCIDNITHPDPADNASSEEDEAAAAVAFDKLVCSRIKRCPSNSGTRYYRCSIDGKRVRKPQTDAGYAALYAELHAYLSRCAKK